MLSILDEEVNSNHLLLAVFALALRMCLVFELLELSMEVIKNALGFVLGFSQLDLNLLRLLLVESLFEDLENLFLFRGGFIEHADGNRDETTIFN
jgi:hypothetical protein